MSLVFSAIVPHPPIIIPDIGKENLESAKKTKLAIEQITAELYAAQPDIVIIISSHGPISPESFTANLSEEFEINFKEFGNFATKLKTKGDLKLITSNKQKIRNKFPLEVISEIELDYSIGIPLFYFLDKLKQVKILPLYFSLLDHQAHFEFGKIIKDIVMETNQRVAIIASAELSHALTESSPAGYHPAGKEFDEKLIELIKNKDINGFTSLDDTLVEQAAECGFRSILILLGCLYNINFYPEIISYEAPFGIGYLTANLRLE